MSNKQTIMCLILINKGKKVDYFDFREMYLANQDGIGFMYHDVESRKVITQKIMIHESLGSLQFHDKLEKVYRVYEMIYNSPKFTNLIVHFRKASTGAKNIENVHPFHYKDANDVDCYLVHNGHIYDYQDVYFQNAKHLGYVPSDTYNFVTSFLEGEDRSMDLIGLEVGRHQKMVILKDGDLDVHTTDMNYFTGIGELIDEGNIYSNYYWVPEGGG